MSPQTEETILTTTEREALKMISAGKDTHSQRAAALLAIDSGATQAQAAEQTGLTRGQVKYWLAKFRQVRLDIFPQPDTLVEDKEKVSEPKAVQKDEKPTKPAQKGKKAKGKKAEKPKKKKGKGKGKKKKSKKNKNKSK